MCLLSCRLNKGIAGSSCGYNFPGGPWSLGVCPRSDPIAVLHHRWDSGERKFWRERNVVVIQRLAKLLDCYPEEIGAFLRELTLQNYSRLLYPEGCGRSPCNVPLCHPTVCERYLGIFDEGGNLRDPTNPRSLFSLLFLLQRCLNRQPLDGCSGLPINSNTKCGFGECYPRVGRPEIVGLDQILHHHRLASATKQTRISDQSVGIISNPSPASIRVRAPRSSLSSAYNGEMDSFTSDSTVPGLLTKLDGSDPPKNPEVENINIERRSLEVREIFNDFSEKQIIHVDSKNLIEAIRLVDLAELESVSDQKQIKLDRGSASKLVDGISKFYNEVVGSAPHPKNSIWRKRLAALYKDEPGDTKRTWTVKHQIAY
nr:uncharacterized protein LOC108130907 [Drosophila bipectinata]